jgi:hypothetical protein
MDTTETRAEENLFRTVFASRLPKKRQREMAVAILLEALDRPENPTLAAAWANLLMNFSGEHLAAAFTQVTLTAERWPSLGNITAAIFEHEYAQEFPWLLQALRRHGVDWKDREACYGPSRRAPGSTIDDPWISGDMIAPAEHAPAIPSRLMSALALYGGGTLRDGLAELNKHPSTHAYQWDAVESARMKQQIEKDFRAAWMTVRRKELA